MNTYGGKLFSPLVVLQAQLGVLIYLFTAERTWFLLKWENLRLKSSVPKYQFMYPQTGRFPKIYSRWIRRGISGGRRRPRDTLRTPIPPHKSGTAGRIKTWISWRERTLNIEQRPHLILWVDSPLLIYHGSIKRIDVSNRRRRGMGGRAVRYVSSARLLGGGFGGDTFHAGPN